MYEGEQGKRKEFPPISEFRGENGIYQMPSARFIGIKHHHLPGKKGKARLTEFLEAVFASDAWTDGVLSLPNIIGDELCDFTCEYDKRTDSFSFIVGVFTPAGTPVPQGMDFRDVSATLVLVAKKGRKGSRLLDGFEVNFGPPGYPWQAFLRKGTSAVIPIKRVS